MNNLAILNEPVFDTLAEIQQSPYSQLIVHDDPTYKIAWALMKSDPRPCFTPTLIKELNDYAQNIKAEMIASNGQKYDYLVLASDIDGVFNLGGDLNLFRTAIQNRDRLGLLDYAIQCTDMVYQNMVHFESDLTSISLVQGDALGGGF